MFLVELIGDLIDVGLMWLVLSPDPRCPKCGGEAMRARKRGEGIRRWHCRDCCNEWSATNKRVVDGNDERTS